MNKSELISAMAAEGGLSKADSKRALDAFIASVTKALKAGDKVALVGFGTFSVMERAGRIGINPATKKPIQIEAKKVAKFKPGSVLPLWIWRLSKQSLSRSRIRPVPRRTRMCAPVLTNPITMISSGSCLVRTRRNTL